MTCHPALTVSVQGSERVARLRRRASSYGAALFASRSGRERGSLTEQLPPLPLSKHTRVWLEVLRTTGSLLSASAAILAALRIYGVL